jgi:hypothetical protein
MNRLGRLGLKELVQDHRATLVEYDSRDQPYRSRTDYLLFVWFPLGVGAFCFAMKVQMLAVDAMLTAVSILTGLLFGLLIHVLELGLALAKDDKIPVTAQIVRLTRQLRANVAWACAVGLVLAALLTGVASFVDLDTSKVPALATAAAVTLAVHLTMTLLMILKRVRSTYNMLG